MEIKQSCETGIGKRTEYFLPTKNSNLYLKLKKDVTPQIVGINIQQSANVSKIDCLYSILFCLKPCITIEIYKPYSDLILIKINYKNKENFWGCI